MSAEKAKFTHEVYQNEMDDEDIDFIAQKHQPYFEFEIKGEKCLIGLDKILECIVIAEKIGEIPKLNSNFWSNILEKFNVDYYDFDVKLSQEH